MSASSASGELGSLVTATVVTARPRASLATATISSVRPLCENRMSTSPGDVRAMPVSAMCVSDQAQAGTPIRYRRCCNSEATVELPPTPEMITRPAAPASFAARSTSARSRCATASATIRPTLCDTTSATWSMSSSASMPTSPSQVPRLGVGLSDASAIRNAAYPLRPSARHRRVMLPVETPQRSDRSRIVVLAAAAGSARMSSASARWAAGMPGSMALICSTVDLPRCGISTPPDEKEIILRQPPCQA